MINKQFENSLKGFKAMAQKIHADLGENSENLLEIVFEGDENFKNYNYQEFPSAFVLNEIFSGDSIIRGSIYVNDKLKHKKVIFKKEIENSFRGQEGNSNEEIKNNLSGIVDQFKLLQEANNQITTQRIEMLNDSFKTQLEGIKSIYQQRDETWKELSERETALKIQELEIQSKRKNEIWESVLSGIGKGIKETIIYAKENPGDFADIISAIKSKKVN